MTRSSRSDAPAVVFVTIPEQNHFTLLEPLIAGLAAEGAIVHVLGDQRNAARIERAGATFVDLYGRYSLDEADSTSVPLPVRFVTFAARYATEIVADVADLAPAIVVHDVFAVIGRVVAHELGLPRVAVPPGHYLDPARVVVEPQIDLRVSIAPECLDAVETLRDRYGLSDVSPFSYASGFSRTLNVYLEPSVYLTEDERRAFEPVAFYGSLPSADGPPAGGDAPGVSSFPGTVAGRRVYVSFGSIVWRYFEAKALAALSVVADALAELDDVQGLISVGGADLDPDALASLERPNVAVAKWVDQWQILRQADVLVTHNGLASTHEAIVHCVPMLSVPFFGDQPSLAARCRDLGLATPLVDQPGGPVERHRVRAALDKLARDDSTRRAALEQAAAWELETLAGRDGVHRRILELAGSAGHLA